LGPMLEHHFGIPAWINNDGNLFALGEAMEGLLPEVNTHLKNQGSIRQYKNLLGVTFGTGFGGGIVINGHLLIGDNAAGGEINRIRHRFFKQFDAEEGVSIRGIQREYALYAGINMKSCPNPKELFDIGMGTRKGNKEAAIHAFDAFGKAAGDALGNAVTLVDGLIAIGGGISGAWPLFMPVLIEEMKTPFNTVAGKPLDRLEVEVFNLEDDAGRNAFYTDNQKEVAVPFTDRKVPYIPEKKCGIGISRLGTSVATSIGAYAYAIQALDG
jgi:glucokinase